MEQIEEDVGHWKVGLSDAAFRKKLEDTLKEAQQAIDGAGDLDLSMHPQPTRNMGPDPETVYQVLMVVMATEAVKATTKGVVEPIVKDVVDYVREKLKSMMSDEVQEVAEDGSDGDKKK